MLYIMPVRKHLSSFVAIRICAILCSIVATTNFHAFAQEDIHEPGAPVDVPGIFLEPINMSIGNPDSTRLDLYIQVPYQTLSFVKESDVFRASYDVTLELRDSADALVTEKLWTDNVQTNKYDETVSRHIGKMSQRTLILRPANYNLSIIVRDNETQKVARVQRKLFVRSFKSNRIDLSDMLLVDKLSQEGTKTVIVPNIAGLVAESPEGFKLFFEAYNTTTADSAVFYLSVFNLRGDVVERDTVRQSLPKGRASIFLTVPGAKLTAGEFHVDVSAATIGKSVVDSSATVAHLFTLRWRGLPTPISNFDTAIDQLQYVTDKETIEKIKNADPDKKRQLFFDFWKKRDPTPNTETNEIMDEYYARVEYANRNFSHYLVGWKTDRGMVYIIFGPPNNIEHRPFEMDSKPYEVWTYYEQNREFIFVDQTGFGDYRLQSPLWDIHNRIR